MEKKSKQQKPRPNPNRKKTTKQKIPNNLKGDGEIKPENISNQEKNSSG